MQDLTPGFEAMPDYSRSEEDRAAARRARAPRPRGARVTMTPSEARAPLRASKKKPHQLSLVGFCF